MPGLDQLFTVVEQYQNMSIAYLTVSEFDLLHSLCAGNPLLDTAEFVPRITRLVRFC